MSIEKRLERVEAILDARGLDWDHPRVASDHFAGADKMVVEEPAKEPEPPSLATVAGQDGRESREISPGEWLVIRDAYRDATPADVGKLVYVRNGELEPWIELRLAEVTGADFPYRCTKDGLDPSMWQAFRYACIRNEKPAKEPEPAWEPKVGDWVKVTRPSDWEEWDHPYWAPQMHQFDGKVGKIESEREGRFHVCGFAWYGLRFVFHRDWLTPADPPATEKPPEPEYREPVLPGDAGKVCEFSIDGNAWTEAKLRGYAGHLWQSVCSEVVGAKHWVHARIKKDA